MSNSNSRNLLLTSLTTYYVQRADCCEVIADTISGGSKLSLRILDWFVTHYARVNKIVYYLDGNNVLYEYPENGGAHIRKFNLYLEYRKQLQSYTKMYFDPFRRHERISFVISQTDEPLRVIETTVGQLNFFRWATENRVIEYVLSNISNIEQHMATHQKTPYLKRDYPNVLSHGPCHVLFN